MESLFNKFAGLEVCDFIKKRLQLSSFPLNIAIFLRTPVLRNICERVLLSTLETSKNESFRYFQRVYKETKDTKWVNKPLQKSKAIFV